MASVRKANIQICLLKDDDSGLYAPAIIITDEKFGELRYELVNVAIQNKERAEEVLKFTTVAVEAVGLDRAQRMRDSKP